MTLKKIQISTNNFTEILNQITSTLHPLTKKKLKLLKTLQKILESNISIIDGEKEMKIAEMEMIKHNYLKKLVDMRKNGTVKSAKKVTIRINELIDNLRTKFKCYQDANINKLHEGDDNLKNFGKAQAKSYISKLNKIRQINDGIPFMIEKFERAINVVKDANIHENANDTDGTNNAILFFGGKI